MGEKCLRAPRDLRAPHRVTSVFLAPFSRLLSSKGALGRTPAGESRQQATIGKCWSSEGPSSIGGPAVLRVSHSAVVAEWRARDRHLRQQGIDVTLVTAKQWNEGGTTMFFEQGEDSFATAASTFGDHPNGFLYDPRLLWRLLGSRTWDLIDVHEEPFSAATGEILLLRSLRRRTRSIPFVLYSAQNLDRRYPVPFGWIERFALRRASGAYPCNEEAGRRLRRHGLSGQLAVVPLGVDLSLFEPAERPPPRQPLRVGYVGRLVPHKGVEVLLDAVASEPDLTLRVIGDGPERDDLRARAECPDLAGRVTFAGFRSYGELRALYRDLDVVAVPSLETPTWVEQFCRVAVEAMASGVPVVASDSGALPEVVGAAGLLVPPGDAQALRTALIRLLRKPDCWTELRRAALSTVGRFSWAAVAKAQAELYRGALARGDRAHLSPAMPRSGGGAVIDDARPCYSAATPLQPAVREAGLEAVVVAYGSPELLRRCLLRLDGACPVTVVDNSSSPEAAALASDAGARYLDPGKNLGFAAGVNVALSSIGPGKDVLLVNPDALVGPEVISALRAALDQDPGAACAAPRLYDPNSGTYQRVCWHFPTPIRTWAEAIGLGPLLRSCDFLIGAVLLLRAEAVAQVGNFDERFFLNSEETDWQRRAHQSGWHVRLVDSAFAEHAGGGTGGDAYWREANFYASVEQYARKWHGEKGWVVMRAGAIVGAAIRAVLLRGEARQRARRILRIYVAGPAEEAARRAGPDVKPEGGQGRDSRRVS